MTPIVLIGVRKHSQRVPRKAWRLVGGKPLYQWTFDLAQQLGWPTWVSTDDAALREAARRQNFLAWSQARRYPPVDLDWIRDCLQSADWFDHSRHTWCIGPQQPLVILRITSPFRTARSVRRAVRLLMADPGADSIRAVRPVREHPFKMWRVSGWDKPMVRAYPTPNAPWHSRGFQELWAQAPRYVQSSALEVTRVRTIQAGSLAGDVVLPFKMSAQEHFTIDWPEDLILANHYAKGATR